MVPKSHDLTKFNSYPYKAAEIHNSTYIKVHILQVYSFMTSIMTRHLITMDTL